MTLAAISHCAKVKVMFQSTIASAAADVKTEATKLFEKYKSSLTVERLCFGVQPFLFNSVFRKSRHVFKRTFWCAQRQVETSTGGFSHIMLISCLSANWGGACLENI